MQLILTSRDAKADYIFWFYFLLETEWTGKKVGLR